MRREIHLLVPAFGLLGSSLLPTPASAQRDGFPAVACPPGVPTAPSGPAVRAQRVFLLGRPAEAMPGARAAVLAQPGNPQHQFLLGRLAVAGASFATADSAFRRAVELCPAFGAEVDPQRAQAFMTAFQQGLEAYTAGDTAGAVARWEAANQLHGRRPDAWYNLAVVHAQRGDPDRAAQAYREVLRLVSELPAPADPTEATIRAETRRSALSGLLSVAVDLFNRGRAAPARELFAYLATLDPTNRDAWYNHALALYRMQAWAELVPVAERVTRADPLNYNARILLFNAHKGLAEAAGAGAPAETEHRNHALGILEAADALPVYVDEIAIAGFGEGSGRGAGKVTGNTAPAGQAVTLEFTLYRPDGQVERVATTVAAPADGQSTGFAFVIPAGPVASWSYTYR